MFATGDTLFAAAWLVLRDLPLDGLQQVLLELLTLPGQLERTIGPGGKLYRPAGLSCIHLLLLLPLVGPGRQLYRPASLSFLIDDRLVRASQLMSSFRFFVDTADVCRQ